MLANRVRMGAGGKTPDDKWTNIGSLVLIGGDMQAGFFGEVTGDKFITATDFVSQTLPSGNIPYPDTPWLKFAYLGNIQFVPKKPVRSYISYTDLSSYRTGNNTIIVKGYTFKVRLFKATTSTVSNIGFWNDPTVTHGSEWNKLMLPIHEDAPTSWDSRFPQYVESSVEDWGINYSNTDLGIGAGTSFPGSMSWCQETARTPGSGGYSGAVFRGLSDIIEAGVVRTGNNGVMDGWRPVLELVV